MGCIEWHGAKTTGGYGYLGHKGRTKKAHRHAWEQKHGPIPEGFHVLHRCDNPPCVNVDHLFLGTHADNMADMVAKGRSPDARGERNPRSILTSRESYEIKRIKFADPSKTARQIACQYGVSKESVDAILSGRNWCGAR